MMPFILLFSLLQSQVMQTINPTNPEISYMGRFMKENPKEFVCSFPASTIRIQTNSSEIFVLLKDYAFDVAQPNYIAIIVDGNVVKEFPLEKDKTEYLIFTSTDKKFHTIEVCKRTESLIGNIGFLGFNISEKATLKFIDVPKKKILFIGNSITCGYGNEAFNATETFSAKTENAYMSYASIAARALQAEYHLIAYSGKGIYRNWADTVFDVETMPFIFEQTTAYDMVHTWNHMEYSPNFIVINLGTNDFSPPLGAKKDLFISRYVKFLQHILEIYPQAYIVCVNSQMLVKQDRTDQIEWIQESIKQIQNSRLYFCKLSVQGTVGYGAEWHPNIVQNKINAKELIDFITLLSDKK